jgi:hypothetical protein
MTDPYPADSARRCKNEVLVSNERTRQQQSQEQQQQRKQRQEQQQQQPHN